MNVNGERDSWHKRFASESNNRAWDIVEQAELTATDVDELLHAAHAAAWHWEQIGDQRTTARAHVLLAFAHAFAGNGTAALRFATLALDHMGRDAGSDWEVAFTHAAAAAAAHSAGRHELHVEHYAEAARRGEMIGNDEDRALFLKTFRRVIRP
jgi:hypothetical protein